MSKSKKVLLIMSIIVFLFYYCWPYLSKVNILSPKEQEMHGYLKEAIPALRSTLQKFKQLDENPVNASFAGELGSLSENILTINEKYWKTGSRSKTFLRIIMDKVRGMKKMESSFLVQWRGPENDPKALNNMRMDTRTLIYRAWALKEDSNKLAKGLQNMLNRVVPDWKNSTLENAALVENCRRTLGDVDQVYRRWKGNYRHPVSFSSNR